MTPIVVFSPGRGGPTLLPARRSLRASANVPSAFRTPATTRPVAGSMISPTAFTATIAPTINPFGNVIADEPSPAFVGRSRLPGESLSLPTVAPAPAPTLPSGTAFGLAAWDARYPQSAVGLIFGLRPTDRSKMAAAGTIGTLPDAVGKPMSCSS